MAPGKRRRGLSSLKNARTIVNPQSLKLTRPKPSTSRSGSNSLSCFQRKQIGFTSTRRSLYLLQLAVVSPAIRRHGSIQHLASFLPAMARESYICHCFSGAGLAGQLKQPSLPPKRPHHPQKLARKLKMISAIDVSVPVRQDNFPRWRSVLVLAWRPQ